MQLPPELAQLIGMVCIAGAVGFAVLVFAVGVVGRWLD